MLDDLITVAPLGQDNADKAETKRMSPGFLGIKEFLEEIFEGARGNIWTTAFESFATGENWHGSGGCPGLTGWEQRFPTMDADMFFAIGLMGAGETRRSNTGVIAQPLLIVDDVGTKVDRGLWEALFMLGCPLPTARIETSPGNETWVWALDGDASDPTRWQDLALIRAWLIERKLTDEVMDPARYVRLPGGWNSKPKYRGADGKGTPPRVSLVDWRPPSVVGRVDVDALGQAIVGGGAGWRTSAVPVRSAGARATLTGGQLAAGGAGALARTADLGKPDALLRLAVEIGLSPRQVRAGVVEADCPNMGSHTTRADTGFAFLGDGLMQCNHASCQGHNTVSFREMMLDRLAGVLGSERAAGEWWAHEQIKDAGGLDDVLEAATVADAMVGARAARVEREEAAAVAQTHAALSVKAIQPVQNVIPSQIPPRQWIYADVYLRGVYSLLVASGGSGKSALAMVEALAITAGRELIPGQRVVCGPKTVWYHNGEDSQDDQQRRLAAAMMRHGITHAELGGRLILTSGHDNPIKLGGMGQNGPELTPGAVDWIVKTARGFGVDVLILDPLGAVHALPENSNEAMNLLAGGLSRIAIEANLAIGLVHHVSQAAAGNMRASGANAARGATALVDRSRNTRQIVRPDEKEAPALGIKADERWRFLAVVNGKANNAYLANVHWVKLVSVPLGNGTPDYPAGDDVQTVEHWTPPKGLVGAPSDLAGLQDAIRARAVPPRHAAQAPDWVGYLLADLMGLDAGRGSTQDQCTAAQIDARARVKAMIQTWIASGGLVVETRPDPKGKHGATIAYIQPGLPAILADNSNADVDKNGPAERDGPGDLE